MPFDKFSQSRRAAEWTSKVHELLDEMYSRTFVQFNHGCPWKPSLNVYETRDRYFVCVDLAGVDESSIDVRCVESRRLIISGARSQPRPQPDPGTLSVVVMEIDEGAFVRQVDLPEPIDSTRVDARYAKGILWITLARISPQ